MDGRTVLPRGLGGGAPPSYPANLTAMILIDPLHAQKSM
jgi:hypothetical protein